MDAYGSTFTENGHPQGAHTVGLGAGQAYYGGSSVGVPFMNAQDAIYEIAKYFDSNTEKIIDGNV